ncbi:MAG: hypothetical protein ABEN55_12990, partial [Bradymonadaceae bacterium]
MDSYRETPVDLEEILTEIESFARDLESEATEHFSIESAAGLSLPDDYAAALRRGFSWPETHFEDEQAAEGEDHASVGFDFLEADIVVRQLDLFESLADLHEGDVGWVYENSVPISFSEPNLAVSERGVHLMLSDGEPDPTPITDSFTEFMRHWLAAGCFSSHSFALYRRRIGDLMPADIPPSDNRWLQY